jgi:hypothetical protein
MHYALCITHYVLRFTFLPWLGLALVAGLFYLAVATWGGHRGGFPLDDAWIHQTYARNLAQSGQLAFTPGVPSAGSTAPLWTLLLSLAYLLGVPFQWWTYGLGILLLGLSGWTASRLAEQLFPESRRIGLWVGLFVVLEWHLVWAAVSGMETILFVWISLFLVERYFALSEKKAGLGDFGLGILGGLLILTRPEGLGLIGLIGLDMARCWWGQGPIRRASDLLRRWAGLGLGLGLVVAPYIAFHLHLTGLPFPNTFYAKQAEYSEVLRSFSLWQRLFGNIGPTVETVQGVFRVIFIGAQFLLLPGLIWAGRLTWRERRWGLLLLWAWWVGFLLLYGLRLPVTYQHGRYQIPAIAWIVLLGVWGTARLIQPQPKHSDRNLLRRVARRALAISLGALVIAFVGVGAQAYRRDVYFIESEMAATAKWLAQHVEPGALIAAHDIGAIGYFTQRPLIDLAGLITPEVIPIIRNETALFEFILSRRAGYLVTFPAWYPEMTQQPHLKLRYSSGAEGGSDSMAVYEVTRP